LSKIESLSGYPDEVDCFGSPISVRFDSDLGMPDTRRINDSDGDFLSTLKNVKDIALCSTPITDQILPHLAELKGLERVSLEHTDTTWAALKELELKLPNCDIYHDKNPMYRVGSMRGFEQWNFYAMRKAVVATQIFVRDNNGKWPSSWNDLKKGVPDNFDLDFAARHVEFNFEADVSQLSKQSWETFSGIRPHQPCWTLYDSELKYLIEMLSQNRAE